MLAADPNTARSLAATVARWLERGVLAGPCTRALARVHAPFASRAIARPVTIPTRPSDRMALVTITIGGATLGGSGKTRVALACARELASRGAKVVLLGHAYRARPRFARVVSPSDSLDDVGDEALACARELSVETETVNAGSVLVVVGPTRQAAIDFAASSSIDADAIVIDGPLQLRPSSSSLAILALDAEAPWGAGEVVPAGDLRAPREALLASADHVVRVEALPCGAMLEGSRQRIALASLRGARLGLFTAIARSDRLERALKSAGLSPSVVIRAGDHGRPSARMRRAMAVANVDIWLATTKCALHLSEADRSVPLAILDGSIVLPPTIVHALGSALVLRRHSVGAAPTSVA